MFKSYDYKYFGYDKETARHKYEITIVDDEFIETSSAAARAAGAAERAAARAAARTAEEIGELRSMNQAGLRDAPAAAAAASAAIDIYSRRNLNVAKNIWLLSQYCDQRWGKYDRISLWQKYVPKYSKYHDDLKMYLTFS